jgi:PPOX class probable F420-dependent enzyme
MNDTLETLRNAKTVMLRTYKRDGTPIPTPVSIGFNGDRAFFRSYDKAWKTARLRNNPAVEVAPSTFRGRVKGPVIAARARLLTDGEAHTAGKGACPTAPHPAGSPRSGLAPPDGLPADALRVDRT